MSDQCMLMNTKAEETLWVGVGSRRYFVTLTFLLSAPTAVFVRTDPDPICFLTGGRKRQVNYISLVLLDLVVWHFVSITLYIGEGYAVWRARATRWWWRRRCISGLYTAKQLDGKWDSRESRTLFPQKNQVDECFEVFYFQLIWCRIVYYCIQSRHRVETVKLNTNNLTNRKLGPLPTFYGWDSVWSLMYKVELSYQIGNCHC